MPGLPAAAPRVVAHVGFWRRLGASLIDSLILYGLEAMLTVMGTMVGGSTQVITVIIWLLGWLYWWLFTGLRGQTLGKMLLGIKVVDRQGDIPGLGRAALREILGKLISGLALCIGYLWIAWDEQKQGWHDKIADTHVITAR